MGAGCWLDQFKYSQENAAGGPVNNNRKENIYNRFYAQPKNVFIGNNSVYHL